MNTYTYRTYVDANVIKSGRVVDEQTMDSIFEYGTRSVLQNSGVFIKRKNCRYNVDQKDIQKTGLGRMIAVNLVMRG